MAKWKCGECGTIVGGRCRPGNCPSCGAPKEKFERVEEKSCCA